MFSRFRCVTTTHVRTKSCGAGGDLPPPMGAAMKKALITGITGQDGSYLAELLLEKGYEVHGLIRRASTFNTGRIDHLYQDPHDPDARLFLHYGDLTDGSRLVTLLETVAARRGVQPRGAVPRAGLVRRARVHRPTRPGMGTTRLLEAIRMVGLDCRFYQASQLGDVRRHARRRRTRTRRSTRAAPYGAAKVYSYWMTRNYREAYGMFAVQRHPLQPRVPAPRRDLRDPQDHAWRGREHRRRQAGRPLHGQPRRGPRLGLRQGVRRGACGGCSRPTSPSDYVVATGTGVHGARLPAVRLRARRASTGRSTSGSTSATCAPPRSTP